MTDAINEVKNIAVNNFGTVNLSGKTNQIDGLNAQSGSVNAQVTSNGGTNTVGKTPDSTINVGGNLTLNASSGITGVVNTINSGLTSTGNVSLTGKDNHFNGLVTANGGNVTAKVSETGGQNTATAGVTAQNAGKVVLGQVNGVTDATNEVGVTTANTSGVVDVSGKKNTFESINVNEGTVTGKVTANDGKNSVTGKVAAQGEHGVVNLANSDGVTGTTNEITGTTTSLDKANVNLTGKNNTFTGLVTANGGNVTANVSEAGGKNTATAGVTAENSGKVALGQANGVTNATNEVGATTANTSGVVEVSGKQNTFTGLVTADGGNVTANVSEAGGKNTATAGVTAENSGKVALGQANGVTDATNEVGATTANTSGVVEVSGKQNTFGSIKVNDGTVTGKVTANDGKNSVTGDVAAQGEHGVVNLANSDGVTGTTNEITGTTTSSDKANVNLTGKNNTFTGLVTANGGNITAHVSEDGGENKVNTSLTASNGGQVTLGKDPSLKEGSVTNTVTEPVASSGASSNVTLDGATNAVNGNITAQEGGSVVMNGTTSNTVKNGTVTATGPATGPESTVTMSGGPTNITAPNDGKGDAVKAEDRGKVTIAQLGTVNGNLNATKSENGQLGGTIDAKYDPDATLTGNVTASGEGSNVSLAASDDPKSKLTMKGDVTASEDGSVTLGLSNGSKLTTAKDGVQANGGIVNVIADNSKIDVSQGGVKAATDQNSKPGSATVTLNNGSTLTGVEGNGVSATGTLSKVTVNVGKDSQLNTPVSASQQGTVNVNVIDNGQWNGIGTKDDGEVNVSLANPESTWTPGVGTKSSISTLSGVGKLVATNNPADKAGAQISVDNIKNPEGGKSDIHFVVDLKNPKPGRLTVGAFDPDAKVTIVANDYGEALKDAQDNKPINGQFVKPADGKQLDLGKLITSEIGQLNPGESMLKDPLVAVIGGDGRILIMTKEQAALSAMGKIVSLSAPMASYGSLTSNMLNDTLTQRMGAGYGADVTKGAWARVYRDDFGQSYEYRSHVTGAQFGYQFVNTINGVRNITSVAIQYDRHSLNYDATNGKGRMHGLLVGLYNTIVTESGHVIDLQLKAGQIKSEFDVQAQNHVVSGDYKMPAISVGVEYGYRFKLGKKGYVMPQIQAQFTHEGSANYTTSSGTQVELSRMNSALGRIGVESGMEFKPGLTGYVKGSAIHEFNGKQDILARDISTGNKPFTSSVESKATWYTAGAGVTYQVRPGVRLFIDAEKLFGDDYRDSYKVNGGVQYRF